MEKIKIELRPFTAIALVSFLRLCGEKFTDTPELKMFMECTDELELQLQMNANMGMIEDAMLELEVNKITGRLTGGKSDKS